MKAESSRLVSGQILNETGQPLANMWVYLKRLNAGAGEDATMAVSASLGVVKTDASGRWSARLHPADAATFGLGMPVGAGGKRNLYVQPVNASQAAAGIAVSRFTPMPKKVGAK